MPWGDLVQEVTLRLQSELALSLLSRMASCAYEMPFARLHLHWLQTWFQSIYSPEKVINNAKGTILASLIWQTMPEKV